MKIINLQRRHYRVYSSSSMGSNLEKQIIYKDDITQVVPPPLLWALIQNNKSYTKTISPWQFLLFYGLQLVGIQPAGVHPEQGSNSTVSNCPFIYIGSKQYTVLYLAKFKLYLLPFSLEGLVEKPGASQCTYYRHIYVSVKSSLILEKGPDPPHGFKTPC